MPQTYAGRYINNPGTDDQQIRSEHLEKSLTFAMVWWCDRRNIIILYLKKINLALQLISSGIRMVLFLLVEFPIVKNKLY